MRSFNQYSLLLNEDVVAVSSSLAELYVVAKLSLQAHVRGDAVTGLRIDPRQIAGIRIAVRIAVLDIEQENGIVFIA
jgi:hypothetical protein